MTGTQKHPILHSNRKDKVLLLLVTLSIVMGLSHIESNSQRTTKSGLDDVVSWQR